MDVHQIKNLSNQSDADLSKVIPEQAPFIRPLAKGMGEAVARRTVYRASDEDNWGNVAKRVALGNTSLVADGKVDYEALRDYIASGTILLSGRHLQHGDENQSSRNLEIYSNCSTSAASFLLFYLLLNGSGVGRDYSDAMMNVNWDDAPELLQVCFKTHPNFDESVFVDVAVAQEKLINTEKKYIWFTVPDSREGWAQAAELFETLTFEKASDMLLVLDWSEVRESGRPIGGMQDRPASGPVPSAYAFKSISELKGKGYPLWQQAMFVDHYLAECVVVGGARRSARMSTKYWKDKDILDYISIKKHHMLWSSNNSIIADAEFYEQVNVEGSYAQKVMKALTEAAYFDGTGEPGIINVHNFAPDNIDWTLYEDGKFADSFKYQINDRTVSYMKALVNSAKSMLYQSLTNPCGEINLNILGGYCVIADVVPFFAKDVDDAEQAFRAATRALIRTNTMRSLYDREVKRTNRIGVGFTGLHEFAFKQFGYGFRDLIDEEKSKDFWLTMARFSRAVKQEAQQYSKQLGVNVPVTDTTVKPAGTTSKLFGVTEGAHLPSMREYLRWVQYRTDSQADEIAALREAGYPVRELTSYKNTTIVGFPTQPVICRLGMGDKLVTASEATPEEQYQYLMLLEKYWIRGTDEQGVLLEKDTGNQISYTLKYDPKVVDYNHFVEMIVKYQSKVRCCSVMPFVDTTAYEYQPEEPFGTVSRFFQVVSQIKDSANLEDIDMEHLRCSSGSCPL